jgi:hypothetical protein
MFIEHVHIAKNDPDPDLSFANSDNYYGDSVRKLWKLFLAKAKRLKNG